MVPSLLLLLLRATGRPLAFPPSFLFFAPVPSSELFIRRDCNEGAEREREKERGDRVRRERKVYLLQERGRRRQGKEREKEEGEIEEREKERGVCR